MGWSIYIPLTNILFMLEYFIVLYISVLRMLDRLTSKQAEEPL